MTLKPDPAPVRPAWPRRPLLVGAGYALLWWGLWYASGLLEQIGGISLWFLPAGLRFAALLLLGWRGLLLELATILGLLLLQLAFAAGPAPGVPAYQTLSFFFNLFAYATAHALVVLPLRRWLRDGFDFGQTAHSFLFLGAALAAAALAATAGASYLLFTGVIAGEAWGTTFAHWALGDFIGIVTVVPLLQVLVWPRLRVWLHGGEAARRAPGTRVAVERHAGLQVAAIALGSMAAVMLVARWLADAAHFPLVALLLLLPLAVVAMLYRLRGAVLAVMLFDTGMVLALSLFQRGADAVPYQLVMIANVLVGLWLGGAIEARQRSMKRYQDFAGVANDLLWEIDADGRLTRLDGRMARFVKHHVGRTWQGLLTGVAPAQRARLERQLSVQKPFLHLDLELPRGAAGARWVQLSGLPLRNDAGDPAGFRGTASNVTRDHRARDLLRHYNRELAAEVAERTQELRLSRDALAVKERHLNLMFAAVPAGVVELDAGGRCSNLNAHGEGLSGWRSAEARGRRLTELVQAQDRDAVAAALAAADDAREVRQFECRMERTGLWCAAHWSRLPPTASSAGGIVVVFTDVTARQQRQELLWRQAHHDTLTGLPNRALFRDRCHQALSLARRHGTQVALLWIDLDNFKPVNDRLGHAAGDALLQQVAQRLSARLRDSDTLARLGGDEFAVVLPDVHGPDQAVVVAGELIAALAGPFTLPQGAATVSCSVGVALYPGHGEDYGALAHCADAALYQAKNDGKGAIRVGQPLR